MYNRRNQFVSGFTLPELMIAMTVTVLILLAIATAFNASANNFKANQEMFDATNKARQALSRMTTQIRSGIVDPNDSTNETFCRLVCSDSTIEEYWYDADNDRLYLQKDGTDYLLCENVTAATFKKGLDDGEISSVQMILTVQSGDVEKQLSAAAVVRRVLE